MTPTHELPSPWYADGLGNDVWPLTAHPLPPMAGLGLPYCFRSLPPAGLHPKWPGLENRLSYALLILQWNSVLPRPGRGIHLKKDLE